MEAAPEGSPVVPVNQVTTATELAGVRATRARTIREATPETPGTLAEVTAADQAEMAAPVVRVLPVEDQVGVGGPEVEVVELAPGVSAAQEVEMQLAVAARVLPVEDQVGVGGLEVEVVELAPGVAAAVAQETVARSRADKAAIRFAMTQATGYSQAVGVNSGQLYGFDQPGLGGRLVALARHTGVTYGHSLALPVLSPPDPPTARSAWLLRARGKRDRNRPPFLKPPALHAKVDF